MVITPELRQAFAPVPDELRARIVRRLPQEPLEELRLKCEAPVIARTARGEYVLDDVTASGSMVRACVESACAHSVYAAQNMLRQGYVILPGGHRMGLCGTGVYQSGELTTLREISSVNLRVARQCTGCAERPAGFLWTHPQSSLILGPPGRGKTTLLRELIRTMAGRFGWRVGVVDERQELAACLNGVPQLDVGLRSDILSGVGKAQGVELLLRSMRPQWIALDEITAESDVVSVSRAAYCGVRFLATVHADSREELSHRPVYRMLLAQRVFENLLTILPDRTVCTERMNRDD